MTQNKPSDVKVNPRALKMAAAIYNACAEVKGYDIRVLDVAKIFSLSDLFVIASGRSDRQVQGICNKIMANLEAIGEKPLAVEGFEKAHWVLVDYGEVVVHIFFEPVRKYYDLESLWRQAPEVKFEESRSGTSTKVVAA